MKIAGGLKENGVIIGNTYDKYGSANPIVRLMMRGYENSLNELVSIANPASIHEVGCGEGYWSLKWLEKGIETIGSDFSSTVINMAKKNAEERNLKTENFIVRDIYNLDPISDTANLVVCCQVLEHLENPIKALEALSSIAKPYVIICVPNEPLWSVLNMARGKYWSDWGNTPGHIQKWSKDELIHLVSRYFEIQNTNTPLPWTMILCKNKTLS
jgi:ubiquinone/menaquinone biosynthesis C-methylase UbiE